MNYDPLSALVVVDVQNDFADPNGGLYVRGAEEIIATINEEISSARAAGAEVVYTQDWHPPNTAHFAKDGGIWPVHCVRGSWGADFPPRLQLHGRVVRKGSGGEDGYSGFAVRDPDSGAVTPTGLADWLRGRSITRLAVVGLATDYCVKETVLDAVRAGFETAVLLRGVRAVDLADGDGERALEAMREAGVQIE